MNARFAHTVGWLSLVGLCSSLRADDPASNSSPLNLARQLNTAFAATAEKAGASVVVITVTAKPSASAPEGSNPWELPDLSPDLRRFLEGKMGGREVPHTREGSTRIAYENQGSGIILRDDGYLLTNAHVVDNAEKVVVKFPDGAECGAKIIGVDTPSDLAVLKAEVPQGAVAKLGNSDRLKVGEFAIAIGAPFELEASVTFGHISAKGRQNILEDRGLDQDFLQTDAQINPGNSGGPLVNIEGEVIGINTLIRGMRTGIGFAIPINQAREVADQLIQHGRYTRPWLGVGVRSLRENPEWRDVFPERRDGIVVKEIEAASPARNSELRTGDLITQVNSHAVSTITEFKREIRSKAIGDTLTLDVLRNGKPRQIRIRSKPTPNEADRSIGLAGSAATPEDQRDLGMLLKPLPAELAQQEGLVQGQGVLVSDVTGGSLAERCGIKAGSIVTEINRRAVKSPRQFRDLLRAARAEDFLLLNVVSDGVAHFEAVREWEAH